MTAVSRQAKPRQKAANFHEDLASCSGFGDEEQMRDYFKTEPVCFSSLSIF